MSAELFPLRARGRASSLTTACHGSSAVIISSVLANWYNDDGSSTTTTVTTIILLFASYALLLALFVFVALPETTGLMLEEVRVAINSVYTRLSLSTSFLTNFLPISSYPLPPPPHIFQIEELFDVGSAGCCPDWKTGLVGLRSVTAKSTTNNKTDKDNNGILAPNLEPFEPSTLHKYSGGMRETRFEYFHEEEAPLVPSSAFGHGGYNTLSAGAGAASSHAGPHLGTFSHHAEGHGRDRAHESAVGGIRDVGRERTERD